MQFPETDDGTSAAILLAPAGLPFGTSNQTIAYVSISHLSKMNDVYVILLVTFF